MTTWEPGCCHSAGGPHGKNEPESCCHVHIEDMPSNHSQQGEPPEMPEGWTVQEQNLKDRITTTRATVLKKESENKRRHSL